MTIPIKGNPTQLDDNKFGEDEEATTYHAVCHRVPEFWFTGSSEPVTPALITLRRHDHNQCIYIPYGIFPSCHGAHWMVAQCVLNPKHPIYLGDPLVVRDL
jgi:hypothetical protein